MAGSAFPFLLSILLVTRWVLLPEARAAKLGSIITLGGVQGVLCVLFFEPTWSWWLVVASQTLLPVILLLGWEFWLQREREASGVRLLLLILHVVPAMVWCGLVPPPEWLTAWFELIPERGFLWLAGALLCLKESNVFVRWFFQRLKSSATHEEQKSRDQTGNGRVIGALERLLVYLFLVSGQTLAVPVIVAVKALARFKRMEDDQAFAEYVIIGTFLSLLLALTAYGWTVWALG